MKKRILSIALLSTLLASGCSSTGEGSMSKIVDMVTNAIPLAQESKEWDEYSAQKIKQGVTYSNASPADMQYIGNRMDAEYAAAVDRLSRPFAANKKIEKKLDQANQNYRFQYNHAMAVKDKSSSTIGYCVNYDVTRFENGKATAPDAAGNNSKSFIYVAKDKPISAATVSGDFTKAMCGERFYSQYKNPNDN